MQVFDSTRYPQIVRQEHCRVQIYPLNPRPGRPVDNLEAGWERNRLNILVKIVESRPIKRDPMIVCLGLRSDLESIQSFRLIGPHRKHLIVESAALGATVV